MCGILLSLILGKLLLCNCLSIQTLVVIHRSRNEDKLPCQDKWLMAGGVKTFMNYSPFSNTRTSLVCFHVIRFREQSHFNLKFCHAMSLYALQFSFGKNYYALAENPDELFWAGLKEDF